MQDLTLDSRVIKKSGWSEMNRDGKHTSSEAFTLQSLPDSFVAKTHCIFCHDYRTINVKMIAVRGLKLDDQNLHHFRKVC